MCAMRFFLAFQEEKKLLCAHLQKKMQQQSFLIAAK